MVDELVNPYIAGAPVTEARMFFGREDVFDWIQNSLVGRYADHILVIHGQRRVGKTSVLKQLGNRLPKRYVPVFFDLQGRTHTTLDRFLWWLAREIVRVLKQERGMEIPVPEKDAFSADPEYFESRFLASLLPMLDSSSLLLTFDEFDNLEESEIKETLARPLIDHLRRLMGRQGLNFIFSIGSSGRKLENMQADYTDFFKTALYKKISFLNEEQTQNLITRPVEGILEYDRHAVKRIYKVAGGHPYFTQLTCHELFARCQQTDQRHIRESDVEAILDDVVERGTVNLKFVWDEASDIEKWALASLAHLEKVDFRALTDSLRKQHVRFSESDLTSGLLHLREKDILTSENRFVIHLLRLWLQKNRPIEQVREELTEVNPIANRYIEIGQEFKNSGQYQKAIESFQEALAVSAGNIQAQVHIALVFMDQKDYDKAVAEFEKALVIDDEDVTARSGLCEAHLALGDAAMQKGRAREAAQSYQRVLAINEEHTEARQRMAEISRQRAEKAWLNGRDEEALSAFTEALRFTPEDPNLIARVERFRAEKKAKILAILLTASEKEALAKNWDGAVRSLEEAFTLSPDDETIRRKLADAKAAQAKEGALSAVYAEAQKAYTGKDYDQAVSLFKMIVLEDENYRDASRLLAQAIELRRTAPKWWQSKSPQAAKRAPQPRSRPRVSPKKIGLTGAVSLLVLGLVGGLFWFAKNGLPASFTPAADKTSTASPPPTGTSEPRTSNPANQHQYLYVSTARTWHEARNYCALKGGYLATIQTGAENEFVYQLTGGAGGVWLGASDEAEEGVWSWVTREPWIYNNWAEGEPSNIVEVDIRGENYMGFWIETHSYWNALPGSTHPFVCEWGPVTPSAEGSATPALDPDIQTVLDTIKNEEPIYQISFDFSWDREFYNNAVAGTRIDDGKLIVIGSNLQENRGYLTLPPAIQVSDMFAVEFEFRILESTPHGRCSLGNWGDGEGIGVSFSPQGQAALWRAGLENGAISDFDISKTNTVALISFGEQIAAFINGQFAAAISKPEGTTIYTERFFNATDVIMCEFDNYKIWDLSGVDFSASTETTTPAPTTSAAQQPAWVTEFAEPILAAISGQPPHVQDDIGTATTPWLNYHDGAQFKRINGEMVTSDSNYSWKMWYTDFVIELDYRFLPSATRDQSWTILFRGSEGFSFNYDGGVNVDRYLQQAKSLERAAEPGGSVNHVLILVKEEAVALFINDQPVYYGDLPSGFKNGEASFGFGANIAYDNFKIWNLNDLP